MTRKIVLLCFYLIVLFVFSSGCTSQSTNTQETNTTETIPTTLNLLEYHRIYPGTDGESHFGTVKVEETLVNAAPPAPPLYLSVDKPASKYLFYSFQPGWTGDLHPSPARQFLVLLSGEVEVETSDGGVQQFGPGDIILLEDTWGKGHRSKNIGDEYLHFFGVQSR
ncbi:MAG: cupin domain-containing protein [Methanomicrobiales archaeon]|nr:cupin domain-containing protein [Methanomicrobiales archaeon]